MKRCPIKAHTVTKEASDSGVFTMRQIEAAAQNLDVLNQVSTWVRTYLARTHPELGRSGTVCPFAPEALIRDAVRIAVVRLGEDRKGDVEAAIHRYRDIFVNMEPTSGDGTVYKALLIAFPDVTLEEAPSLIDASKEKHKEQFVDCGLMLGEFHERNESPGLHNPEFRPLRCPVPLLAIRHMVYSDIVFLNRPADPPERRMRFVEAYLSRHDTLRPHDRIQAQRILTGLKAEVAALAEARA